MEKVAYDSLMLTKAICDSVGTMERWNSFEDILDELLADSAIDREEYLEGIMLLTQEGMIDSNINSAKDISRSEVEGIEIKGITDKGKKYIDKLLHEAMAREKITEFIKKFDIACGKLADSEFMRLIK